MPWTSPWRSGYLATMEWADDLDAVGLLCPLPVLKMRKRLGALAPGAVLRAVTDDPAALIDVPHFCAEQGHEIVSRTEEEFPRQVWLIRKASGT